MASTSVHWKATGKQLVTVLLAMGLGACQVPGSPRATMGSPVAGPPTNAKVETASLPAKAGTTVTGHAEFPMARSTQATPAQVINRATLTLTELSTNTPIVTGQTDALGNFSLALNGYAPVTNAVYLLEASKGLNGNSAGAEQVRMRTFLKWSGTGWLSMSNSTVGGAILLNTLTTAVALISNLDPTGIDPANTVGKVNGTSLNASPAYASHSNTEITNLATSLTSYLTNNLDPVAGVSGVLPNLTSISPPNAPAYRTVALMGSGFSPLVGGNTVVFAGGATASVYIATPTALYVVVPASATSGLITVKTSLGTSNAVNFTVDTPSGPILSAIEPSSGAPGDYVTLVGEGYNPSTAGNVVTFQGSSGALSVTPTQASANGLIVQVPNNVVSGAVTVSVGSLTSNRYYFRVNVPVITSVTPLTGNQSTRITLNGGEFGGYGIQSGVLFNESEPQSSIASWSTNQALVYPPPPSPTHRIGGTIRVVSSTGLLSPPMGPFTARTSVTENFATDGHAGAGMNAAWGGGALKPGSPTTLFSQAGEDFDGNTNTSASGMGSTPLGLGLSVPVLAHMGGLPLANNQMQLGVDQTSYYITTGAFSDNPTISRYALKDGALLGTCARPGVSGLIWDRVNGCYVSYNANVSQVVRTYTHWNDAACTSQHGGGSTFLATNGAAYFLWNLNGLANIVSTTFYNLYNYGIASTPVSVCGIAGSSTFYVSYNSAGFSTYDAGGTTGTAPCPIGDLRAPTGGSYVSTGSDGKYIYVLGSSVSFNGGANSLFKFAVNGATLTLAGTPSGTSVTPAIVRPANTLWDVVNFSRTLPAGTACVVDVLDGATDGVLLSNVTNGQSLSGLTASSIKLRATLTGTTSNSPTLASWSVTTRGNYALSSGYDTGTNFATYEAPSITATNANYTLQYADSADNVAWGAWVSNVTTLSRRYIRYQVILNAANTQITGITLPYQY